MVRRSSGRTYSSSSSSSRRSHESMHGFQGTKIMATSWVSASLTALLGSMIRRSAYPPRPHFAFLGHLIRVLPSKSRSPSLARDALSIAHVYLCFPGL